MKLEVVRGLICGVADAASAVPHWLERCLSLSPMNDNSMSAY